MNSNSQNGMFTWECVRSFPHILPHSQDCECDFRVAFSARTSPCPCLGHELKAKVMIGFLVVGIYYYSRCCHNVLHVELTIFML
jgi:hypothetical protein